MPSKNSIKTYRPGGIYHAYNRGINKNAIFLDKKDYQKFTSILEETLLSKSELIDLHKQLAKKNHSHKYKVKLLRQTKNYHEEISVIAFCLMPNHFHMLLKQSHSKAIANFFRAVQGRYSAYFNKKYQRIGPLFQSRYKAILVRNDTYLRTVFEYIHNNPSELPGIGPRIEKYPWSSLGHYKGIKKNPWIRSI